MNTAEHTVKLDAAVKVLQIALRSAHNPDRSLALEAINNIISEAESVKKILKAHGGIDGGDTRGEGKKSSKENT